MEYSDFNQFMRRRGADIDEQAFFNAISNCSQCQANLKEKIRNLNLELKQQVAFESSIREKAALAHKGEQE